jgi:hypothetical protein
VLGRFGGQDVQVPILFGDGSQGVAVDRVHALQQDGLAIQLPGQFLHRVMEASHHALVVGVDYQQAGLGDGLQGLADLRRWSVQDGCNPFEGLVWGNSPGGPGGAARTREILSEDE